MKRITLVLGTAILLASCNSTPDTTAHDAENAVTQAEIGQASAVQTIDSQHTKQLLAKQADMVVLDVRTPEEYAAGHLQNAQLLNIYDQSFMQRLQELDKSKPYLVYCAVGGRSNQAVQTMEKMGFKQVYDATEGFSALKNAGVPVE